MQRTAAVAIMAAILASRDDGAAGLTDTTASRHRRVTLAGPFIEAAEVLCDEAQAAEAAAGRKGWGTP